MSTRTYTVLGATGNTGNPIALALLEAGHNVRAVGRTADRLAALVQAGAEAHVGDITDADFLTTAFTGADAVYTLLPPAWGLPSFRAYQARATDAILDAIDRADVSHSVLLSSIGAHLPSGTGPIVGLYDHEQRLAALTTGNHLALRAPYFLENMMMSLETAKTQGFIGSPLVPDAAFPVMATSDIAHEATRALLELDFTGFTVRELIGPANVSMRGFTDLVAARTGTPIAYVQFPYEAAQEALTAMVGPDMAALYVEMYRGFNSGAVGPQHPDTTIRSGQVTPEVFAGIFAAAMAG